MTTQTKKTKTTSAAATRTAGRQRPPVLLLAVVGALLVAGLVALIVSGVDDDTSESSEPSVAPASATGNALPLFSDGGTDPAVGETPPVIRGEGLDGEQVEAPRSGRPTVLLFLAHWCPHCQAEVPEVQAWLESGGLPEDVDLVAVSTAIDPARPNYPPSEWLDREGWSAPTVTDTTSDVAAAYGLANFPYWVAVDADGSVVTRHAGSLGPDGLDALVDATRNGAPGSGGGGEAAVTADDAWASASVDTAAAYVTLENAGEPDALVGASSPAAETVSLMRETGTPGSHDGDHPAELELPEGTTTLEPGVAHIMLEDLAEPLEPGQTIELALELEHADPVTVEAEVLDWDTVVDRFDET